MCLFKVAGKKSAPGDEVMSNVAVEKSTGAKTVDARAAE